MVEDEPEGTRCLTLPLVYIFLASYALLLIADYYYVADPEVPPDTFCVPIPDMAAGLHEVQQKLDAAKRRLHTQEPAVMRAIQDLEDDILQRYTLLQQLAASHKRICNRDHTALPSA